MNHDGERLLIVAFIALVYLVAAIVGYRGNIVRSRSNIRNDKIRLKLSRIRRAIGGLIEVAQHTDVRDVSLPNIGLTTACRRTPEVADLALGRIPQIVVLDHRINLDIIARNHRSLRCCQGLDLKVRLGDRDCFRSLVVAFVGFIDLVVPVSDNLDRVVAGRRTRQGNRLHLNGCAWRQAVVIIALTVLHPIHVEQGFLVSQQSCVGGRSALVLDQSLDSVTSALDDGRRLRPDIRNDQIRHGRWNDGNRF